MQLDSRLQTLLWTGVGLAFLLLFWLLGPILTPFLLAFILAYIANPLVDRLSARRIPRALASVLVILTGIGLVVLLVLILVPLLRREALSISARLPLMLNWLSAQALPWLNQHFDLQLSLDAGTAREFLNGHLDDARALATQLLASLGARGLALIGLVANLILTPVVMFYLLQDWHVFMQRLDRLIPRPWHGKARQILADVDRVLSEFLRGQVLVMSILALYYAIALWLAGLASAIPVGILTGLLIFIPYVGYSVGLVLALAVAALQFQGMGPVMAVLVVYGIGQVLEGFLLTPFLVGERIGLHPLAVIFALLAFGQLFGFVGVLAALPASAALLVGLRELKSVYHRSHFYSGGLD